MVAVAPSASIREDGPTLQSLRVTLVNPVHEGDEQLEVAEELVPDDITVEVSLI